MPQELKIGPYTIYFWSNENDPLEPVHVAHRRRESGTKRDKDLEYEHRKDTGLQQQFRYS